MPSAKSDAARWPTKSTFQTELLPHVSRILRHDCQTRHNRAETQSRRNSQKIYKHSERGGVIPTNRLMLRKGIFRTSSIALKTKNSATCAKEITESSYEKMAKPVLSGTISCRKGPGAESNALKEEGAKQRVLEPKNSPSP